MEVKHHKLPTSSLADNFHSRIAIASPHDITKMIEKDMDAMEAYLAECKCDGMSDSMIPVAENIVRILQSEKSEVAKITIPGRCHPTVELTELELERPYVYYKGMPCFFLVTQFRVKGVSDQDIYLHSVNWRCLQIEYDMDTLPREISGRVIEVESYTMTTVSCSLCNYSH